MTKELIPSLTHDAIVTEFIKNTEMNHIALLELNSALTCLSHMARNTIENYRVNADQFGCLINLYDQNLDRITNDISAQLDAYRRTQAARKK